MRITLEVIFILVLPTLERHSGLHHLLDRALIKNLSLCSPFKFVAGSACRLCMLRCLRKYRDVMLYRSVEKVTFYQSSL